MKFEATDEDIAKIMANAFNASIPVGMGFIHFKPHNIEPNLFMEQIKKNQVALDYVQGRMVKLHMWKDDTGLWNITNEPPHREYQSWATQYPTYKALIDSVLKEENQNA